MLKLKKPLAMLLMACLLLMLLPPAAQGTATPGPGTSLGPDIEITSFNEWPDGFAFSSAYFGEALFDGEHIWMIPQETNMVVKLNPETGETSGYNEWPEGFVKSNGAFSGGVFDGKSVWMIPSLANQLVRVDVETGEMTRMDWPDNFFDADEGGREPYFNRGVFDGEYIWLAPSRSTKVGRLDPATGEMVAYDNWPDGFEIGDYAFNGAVYDGRNIWLIPSRASQVIKLDAETGEMTGYENWPSGYASTGYSFSDGLFDGEYIWLLPSSANMIIRLDPETGEMTGYNDWPSGHDDNGSPLLSLGAFDGQYIWTKYGSSNHHQIYRIDTHTGEIEDFDHPSLRGRYSPVFDGVNMWMIPFHSSEILRLSSVPVMHPVQVEEDEVTLTWTPVNGAVEYVIYESLVQAEEGTEIARVNDAVHTVSNLPPQVAHYYTVKAVYPNRESMASNEVSVTLQLYNARLSSLSLSEGELSPAFDAATTEYEADVPHQTESVAVTAETSHEGATVTVNGTPVASGEASGDIALVLGDNTIEVEVTAPAGNTQAYTVTVNRAASPNAELHALALSEGELSPVFDAATTTYTAQVGHAVQSVAVSPIAADEGATVTVNGSPVASGGPSAAIALTVGRNTIAIEVSAPDGTIKEYSITVERAVAPHNPGWTWIPEPARPMIDLNGELIDPRDIDVSQSSVSLQIGPDDLSLYISIPVHVLESIAGDNERFSLQVETPIGSFRMQIAELLAGIETLLAESGTQAEDVSLKVALTDLSEDPLWLEQGRNSANGEAISALLHYETALVITRTKASLPTDNLLASAMSQTIHLTDPRDELPLYWGAFRANELTEPLMFVPAHKSESPAVEGVDIPSVYDGVYVLTTNPVTFRDMAGHWAEPAARLAAAKGMIQGVGGGRYDPNRSVTSLEFSYLLERAFGYDATQDFAPDRLPLSRERMAAMMVRAIEPYAAADNTRHRAPLRFTDIGNAKPEYVEAIEVMTELNLISGMGDGSFQPHGHTTRAQAAVILIRALTLLGFIDQSPGLHET